MPEMASLRDEMSELREQVTSLQSSVGTLQSVGQCSYCRLEATPRAKARTQHKGWDELSYLETACEEFDQMFARLFSSCETPSRCTPSRFTPSRCTPSRCTPTASRVRGFQEDNSSHHNTPSSKEAGQRLDDVKDKLNKASGLSTRTEQINVGEQPSTEVSLLPAPYHPCSSTLITLACTSTPCPCIIILLPSASTLLLLCTACITCSHAFETCLGSRHSNAAAETLPFIYLDHAHTPDKSYDISVQSTK